MKKVFVKFSVGVKHPLYNQYVEAEILHENCGYNGKKTIARTLKPVFWEENKEGILICKGSELVGYKTTPSHYSIHEGYVDIIKN